MPFGHEIGAYPNDSGSARKADARARNGHTSRDEHGQEIKGHPDHSQVLYDINGTFLGRKMCMENTMFGKCPLCLKVHEIDLVADPNPKEFLLGVENRLL